MHTLKSSGTIPSPAGKYNFLGFVKHEDGILLGDRQDDLEQFDPGVFIDDNSMIYLYSGNAPMKKENDYGEQGSQVMRPWSLQKN